jgi:hypothetical protein
MVKKVNYALVDTKLLPGEMICRNNAFEEFAGLDDYFANEWVNLTTNLNNVRSEIMKRYVPPDNCNTGKNISCRCSNNKKSELFFSAVNQCGIVIVG